MINEVKRGYFEEKRNETSRRSFKLLNIATILLATCLFIVWIVLLIRSKIVMGEYIHPGSTNYDVSLILFAEVYIEIPFVVSILFAIALWCFSRQFEGKTKKVLGVAAILIILPFLFDALISIVGSLLGNFLIHSEAGAFIWLFAMIVTHNLMDVIFYQIAFLLLSIELLRIKKTLGLNTNIIYSSIIGCVLVPITIVTGVIFHYSIIATVIYFWLQVMFYLIWTITCIEFALQLFKMKNSIEKLNEKLSEEEVSRLFEINTSDTKLILNIGMMFLLIYAGLWLIAQIILMIKENLLYFSHYSYLMASFLDLIKVLYYFAITMLGFGILFMDTHLRDERKDSKLLISGTLLITTFLTETIFTLIMTSLIGAYRYMDMQLYTLPSYSFVQIYTIVFEITKSLGLILLGFALRDQRKLKNWKTNLLVIPFLYVPAYITLLVLDYVGIIYLQINIDLQLIIVLIIIAMVLELFFRIRKVDMQNLLNKNSDLI